MKEAASQKAAIWVEEKELKSETAIFVHVCVLLALLFSSLAVSNPILPESTVLYF